MIPGRKESNYELLTAGITINPNLLISITGKELYHGLHNQNNFRVHGELAVLAANTCMWTLKITNTFQKTRSY